MRVIGRLKEEVILSRDKCRVILSFPFRGKRFGLILYDGLGKFYIGPFEQFTPKRFWLR